MKKESREWNKWQWNKWMNPLKHDSFPAFWVKYWRYASQLLLIQHTLFQKNCDLGHHGMRVKNAIRPLGILSLAIPIRPGTMKEWVVFYTEIKVAVNISSWRWCLTLFVRQRFLSKSPKNFSVPFFVSSNNSFSSAHLPAKKRIKIFVDKTNTFTEIPHEVSSQKISIAHPLFVDSPFSDGGWNPLGNFDLKENG